MTAAFRSISAQLTGSGTSAGLALPSGFAAGDALLLFLYKENTAAPTYPSGFTQIASIAATGNPFVLYIARKIATGSESGTQTVSWTGSAYYNAALAAYSGVDTTTPEDVTPTTVASGSLSNQAVAPSISPTSTNTYLVCLAANFGSGGTTWTAPSGMTKRTTTTDDIGVADVLLIASGASGTKTFTLNGTGQAAGISVALRSASATNTSSGSGSLPSLTASGQGAATQPPIFSGQGAAMLGAIVATGAGASAPPSASGIGVGSLGALTAAAAAATTAPSFAGQGAGRLGALTASGLGGFVPAGATTNWSVTVGSGYTDVSPKQLVRTSTDVLYVFGVDCDSYPCTQISQTIRAYKATAGGVPSAFTRQDSAHEPSGIAGWAVAIDGADVVHVLYAERTSNGGNVVNLKYTTYDTATNLWSGTVTTIVSSMNTTTDGQGDQLVAIALDSSGVPHITYVQGNGSARRLFYRNRVGGTWSAATQLDSAVTYTGNRKAWHPNLAFDASGRIVVAWQVGAFNGDADGTIQTVVRSTGGSWGSVVQVAASLYVGIDQSTSLLVTPDGTYHIAFILPENVVGSVQVSYIQYYYSSNQGTTWTANHPGGGTQATHNPALGYAAGKVRIFGHGTPNNLAHGDNLYYFEGTGGAGTWGTWTQIVTGAYDSSVNVRWSQNFHNSPNTWDIAYWADAYPNNLFTGTSIATAPTHSASGGGTLGALAASGQAAATLPTYAGQTAATLPGLSTVGAASATQPTYTGQAAAALPALSTTGAGAATVPSVSGQGAGDLGALLGTGAGAAALPISSGQGTASLPALGATGSATASAPTTTATGAVTLPILSGAGLGSTVIPSVSGQGGASIGALSGSGQGASTIPSSSAAGAGALPNLTATGSAASSGSGAAASGGGTLSTLQVAGQAAATAPITNATGGGMLGETVASGTASATVPATTATGGGAIPGLTSQGLAAVTRQTSAAGTAPLPAMVASAAGQFTTLAPVLRPHRPAYVVVLDTGRSRVAVLDPGTATVSLIEESS